MISARSFSWCVPFALLVGAGCGGGTATPADAPPVTPTTTLTVVRDGSGAGTVTAAAAGIDCGASCSATLDVGTTVTLSAAADGNSTFTGWSGGGCSGTEPCSVVLDAATTVTATFTALRVVTVTVVGTGNVTSNPGGIDCGADCSESFSDGTTVTLTPTPAASTHFTGWSGDCTGSGTCQVVADQMRDITATFDINRYALTVVNSGTGTGTITSAPVGIDCGADCSEDFDHGTMITLAAAASVGSTFAGWSGGGCTGTDACTVTLTEATTVTASYSINQESVMVTRSGTGAGTVTSTPVGIDCGTDCGELYAYGTVVTLDATPAAGSVLTGWTGAGCTGSGACSFTVTGPTTVDAEFTLTRHTLTVTRNGTGAGLVRSTPAGIDCGADCTEQYDYGTTVTLTAVPSVGTTFAGWSGACSGTGNCVTTITAATSVTATFTLNRYALSVTRSGTGTGTVTSSPAGINCGADCAELYNHGTVVTLTAAAANGSSFIGWSGGGCAGTGTCVVTLTAADTVDAAFGCGSGSVTFVASGALQTFTVPSCASSITIDAYGAQGGTSTGESGGQNIVGGLGARVRGTFAVTPNETISILVGGRGSDNRCGSGGGGGSFAVRGSELLVAAGGGGGGFHCNVLGSVVGVNGNISTSGGSGVCTMNPQYVRNPTPGGTGGNGASAGYGGGGGGFLTAGSSLYTTNAGGGVYPGAGGTPGGGFGGGGGYHTTCCGGSGGGGGFSGGGGSQLDGCSGGGGGSFNGGTSQVMTAGTRLGDGVVIITY